MIDIRRLQNIKSQSPNRVIQFVADYILRKTQRDYTEFFNYQYNEDWKELDNYLFNIEQNNNPSDLEIARKLISEVVDPFDIEQRDFSFEKELLNHWNSSY